jgi:hypothetical protein
VRPSFCHACLAPHTLAEFAQQAACEIVTSDSASCCG